MSKYLSLADRLEYVKRPSGKPVEYVLNLDGLPAVGYSIGEAYDFIEGFLKIIDQTNPVVSIKVDCGSKSKRDGEVLFASLCSVMSKYFTTHELKNGEKRLAPRSEIMDQTDLDFVTIKRFLNYKSNGIQFLKVELIFKGKSIMAL